MSYFITRPEAKLQLEEIRDSIKKFLEKEMSFDELTSLTQTTLDTLTELSSRLGTKIYHDITTFYVRFYSRKVYYDKGRKGGRDETITICSMKKKDFEQRREELLDLCNKGKSGELVRLINEINENNKNPKIALRNQGDRNVEIRYSDDYFIKGIATSDLIGRISFKDYTKNKELVDGYVKQNKLKAILELPFVNSIA